MSWNVILSFNYFIVLYRFSQGTILGILKCNVEHTPPYDLSQARILETFNKVWANNVFLIHLFWYASVWLGLLVSMCLMFFVASRSHTITMASIYIYIYHNDSGVHFPLMLLSFISLCLIVACIPFINVINPLNTSCNSMLDIWLVTIHQNLHLNWCL